MKKLLILLLIVSCEKDITEPVDCAGKFGGNAIEDNCGVCDSDLSNDCIQDNCGVWGGNGLSCISSVADIDGNIYETILIEEQLWMKENLKVSRYSNGDSILTGFSNDEWIDLREGGFSIYNNDSSNIMIHGLLYNWFAVDDARGICPDNWHVPDSLEWIGLTHFSLGGRAIAGGKMKTIGTVENGNGTWYSPNTGASNESGFSSLASGYRAAHLGGGGYHNLGYHTNYWSTSDFQDTDDTSTFMTAYFVNLSYDSSNVHIGEYYKTSGFSIRCIKD